MVREDGQVDAHLASAGPIFNDALYDSISSLPPRGAQGNGPSTYWVDRALSGVLEAERRGSEEPFLWGNCTVLRLRGDRVEVRYDYSYDEEESDFVDAADFVALLREWRPLILEQADRATAPLPSTYRRNPAS